MGTAPASAREALEMVRAGLGYLAAADPGQLPAATQAECLRELEQDAAALTAVRAWILASFTAGQGHAGDGDYSAVSWLIHRTGITRGAAVGHSAWSKRVASHPRVLAALATGQVSESAGRLICLWTDKLPLAGAEPVTGSKLPAVQRLQFFLSESVWEPETVNARRLELLRADPATAPHGGGVLVIDDSGDRKDGTRTAHVGRQYLGRYGKTDNGIVTVTTVWADERVYYPVHALPYTPARHFAKGKSDPGFRTKLAEAGLPFVMALRPHRGTWARAADAHTPVEAARALARGGPEDPGDWHPVTRTFRDGHAETWRAADASLGGWGPDGVRRLVVATADPATLPGKATWYLVTNLPRPGGSWHG